MLPGVGAPLLEMVDAADLCALNRAESTISSGKAGEPGRIHHLEREGVGPDPPSWTGRGGVIDRA